MDPVTQAALGAVVGQAVGHRRLGYRAAGIGALAGMLPDADVLLTLSGDLFDEVVHHRGITH
jgi:inner membrane protein